MALVVITWDLPPGERLAIYNEKVRTSESDAGLMFDLRAMG